MGLVWEAAFFKLVIGELVEVSLSPIAPNTLSPVYTAAFEEGQVREELLKVIKNVSIKEIMTRLANSPCTRVASAVANIPQDKRLIASPPAPFTPISLIALIAIGTVSQPVVVLPKSTIRAISAFGINQQLALIIVSTDAEH
ncbi:hypothetical protein FOXB_03916 [Fusarium oxysporum f. sp. conglutinans Fo5176]|uniref:Uncharacterized protein n=1 Tax=Fusarium oxysporum (strain Fo5176) TaxID=660025 RepID=F9FBY8_FUSOF|nr:hypothetical protein FOXB_03916 [Fusarium oxysporum f. sp. conglutinans Fo5176]